MGCDLLGNVVVDMALSWIVEIWGVFTTEAKDPEQFPELLFSLEFYFPIIFDFKPKIWRWTLMLWFHASYFDYSHLSNKRRAQAYQFWKIPPSTFIHFLDSSTLHSSFIRVCKPSPWLTWILLTRISLTCIFKKFPFLT